MLTYKEMKNLLKADSNGLRLKHFTEAFYTAFCEAWKTKNYDRVRNMDFYKLDGFSYCVFQELFHSSLPLWKLSFVKMDQGRPLEIAVRNIHEDTEEDAQAIGDLMRDDLDADFVHVARA